MESRFDIWRMFIYLSHGSYSEQTTKRCSQLYNALIYYAGAAHCYLNGAPEFFLLDRETWTMRDKIVISFYACVCIIYTVRIIIDARAMAPPRPIHIYIHPLNYYYHYNFIRYLTLTLKMGVDIPARPLAYCTSHICISYEMQHDTAPMY